MGHLGSCADLYGILQIVDIVFILLTDQQLIINYQLLLHTIMYLNNVHVLNLLISIPVH